MISAFYDFLRPFVSMIGTIIAQSMAVKYGRYLMPSGSLNNTIPIIPSILDNAIPRIKPPITPTNIAKKTLILIPFFPIVDSWKSNSKFLKRLSTTEQITAWL